MKRIIITLFAFSMVFMACETELGQEADLSAIPVVECFLNPEEGSSQIKVFKLIPYGEEAVQDSLGFDGLQVELSHAGGIYALEEGQQSGRYLIDNSLINWQEEDSVVLSFIVGSKIVSAASLILAKPEDLHISTDQVYYEANNPRSMLDASAIEVSWENPDDGFFFVSIENIEENPIPVNEMVADMPLLNQAPPTQADQFEIRSRNLMYFGTHQIVVYRVNPEFANLFDNPTMNSVSLTEPPTNLTNGLGIFTAYASDTVYLEVIEK